MSTNRSRDGSLQVGKPDSLGYRIGNPPNDPNDQRNQFIRQNQNGQDIRNMKHNPNQSFRNYASPKQHDFNFSPHQNYQPVYRHERYQRPQNFGADWQYEPQHSNYTQSGHDQTRYGYGQNWQSRGQMAQRWNRQDQDNGFRSSQRLNGYPYRQNFKQGQEDLLVHQELSVQRDPLSVIQRLHAPSICWHRNCTGRSQHEWCNCRFNPRNQQKNQSF